MGGRLIVELPFIDEHAVEVASGRDELWRALTGTFGGSGSGLFTAYATLIGVDPRRSEGDLGQVGSTRVGFRVSEADAPGRLLLSGRHRFSTYELEWTVDELPGERSRLLATTRARFPGPHGRLYRALVIDSGAHARITKKMLASVARRAASQAGASA